ncbi:cyclopropane-fatty-acyl-phospholipid synthase family protein [Wenzhouxiangella sp. XN79A]|uniref:class I SAM-dependent methyltransferase n=1 Tax=Wenzhouxiangella sp. XN79A TaxID=2724193 RepID=UPI00197F0FC4
MTNAESPTAASPTGRGAALSRWCRARVLARLATLDGGELILRDPDGEHRVGRATGLTAEIQVHDLGFWRMMATGGSVGAAEAYMAELWDSPDLVAAIRVLAASRDALADMEKGAARLYGGLLKVLHRFNRNSLAGSRRNIAAHYDLGNAFFAEWLDARMQYSSGIYSAPDASLEQAQETKLARIAERLSLGPDDHLLEIGTGWGGLAIYMAGTTGCRVTTTTISKEQHAHAVEAVRMAGLSDRVEVLLKDYRDLEGSYDKLVSVEMIEAVGAEYLDTYLDTIRARLKPDGLALIQAITIEDFRYAEALKSVDFIKRYIFPGSFIPSVSAITASMARATDLGLIELYDFGESYARTLRAWRQRFEAAWARIAPMGFDETFRRRWRFYLAYCEGGFMERAISDVQLVLARPGYRKPGA